MRADVRTRDAGVARRYARAPRGRAPRPRAAERYAGEVARPAGTQPGSFSRLCAAHLADQAWAPPLPRPAPALRAVPATGRMSCWARVPKRPALTSAC